MKTIFTIMLMFAGCATFAQITINYTDIAGVPLYWNMARDTMPHDSVNPGPSGANRVWDFSNSLVMKKNYVTAFVDPLTTPMGIEFSGIANRAVAGNKYTYYANVSAQDLQFVGYITRYSSDTVIFKFQNPQKLLTFPTSYLTSFTDTSYCDVRKKKDTTIVYGPFTFNIDSLRIKSKSFVQSEIDAWGNIKMPTGTYNTLRQYKRELRFDSIWLHVTNYPFPPYGAMWYMLSALKDTIYTYEYIGKNNGFLQTLVKFEWDSLKNKAVTIEWYTDVVTGQASDGNFLVERNIQIFPQPANEYIYINIPVDGDFIVQVNTFSGILLSQHAIKGNYLNRIELQTIPSGIYLITLLKNNEVYYSRRFLISR